MTDEDLAAIRERVARYPDEEDIYALLAKVEWTRSALATMTADATARLREVERLRADRDQMQQAKYRAYEHVERLKSENADMRKIVQAVARIHESSISGPYDLQVSALTILRARELLAAWQAESEAGQA